MSQELERVYTINLGKVLLSPDNQRAKRAINMIKEFARHHMKVEDIKIEEDVAHQIWSRGIKHPPRKIRVRMTRTDEGFVLVSSYDEEIESTVDPKEKPKVEEKEQAKEIDTAVEETKKDDKEITSEVTTEETKKDDKEITSEVTTEETKKDDKEITSEVTTEETKKDDKEITSEVTTEETKKDEDSKKESQTKTD